MNNLEYVDCGICGEKACEPFMRIDDYRGAAKGEFNVVKCQKCGMLYTNPRLGKQAIDNANEETFSPCDIDKSKSAKDASSFIRRHPVLRKIWHQITGEYLSEMLERSRGKVLDLGSGFGDLLEDLTRKGCDAYGVETNPPAVEACLKKGLKVSCSILEDAHFPDNSFDTVILCHVIEHLPYPRETLKEIYRILKPGGLVLVYCPNADSYLARFFGRYWQGWAIPLHLYHFTCGSIRNLAERAGFTVNRIRTVTPEYFFLSSLNRSLLDNKGVFFWGPRTVRIFKNVFFRLSIAFIFRIMDLFFIGKGECLRVELTKSKG